MLINRLTLYTSGLDEMKAFYKNVLDCLIIAEEKTRFAIQLGITELIFEENDRAQPYHFAINIPSNQIEHATRWLRNRCEIIPGPDGEIVDFSSWKAKSVYFYDPDKNIVEFIARERLEINAEPPFDSDHFLSISEIGMPVENIAQTFRSLIEISEFPQFSGSFDTFCAIGSDEGLFIVIDKNKKDWFPSHDPAHSSAFKIIGMTNGQPFQFSFREGVVS